MEKKLKLNEQLMDSFNKLNDIFESKEPKEEKSDPEKSKIF